MSSIEVVEANVLALREAFHEFKSEVHAFKAEVRNAFGNVHDEIKSLREKGDKNYERLSTKIEATNQEVAELRQTVTRTESKLNALGFLWGGVGGLAGLFLVLSALNKIFHWY